MAIPFDFDPYPGRPKVLFIGSPLSSHTHAWIDLLEGAALNVRLFSLQDGAPPPEWKVKTYLTARGLRAPNKSRERRSYFTLSLPLKSIGGMCVQAARMFHLRVPTWASILARVVRAWNPDVVHTLGLEPASFSFFKVREQFRIKSATWVAQVRGGPDLVLHRHLPEYGQAIREVVSSCDRLIADNQQNYDLMSRMGVPCQRLASLGVVPGTGGIDVHTLAQRWPNIPSQRQRLIIWPKAYECQASKALPVLEALRLAWPRIRPCHIYMLAVVQPEIHAWFAQLPQEFQESCTLLGRIPRAQTIDLFLQARVMLAPSLTDGIPNSMLEAMACGAFPIVSPLETLKPLLSQPHNTMFARNLYPEEIAQALARAMTDDALVDAAASPNLEFVSQRANRDTIRPRVIAFYKDLANENKEIVPKRGRDHQKALKNQGSRPRFGTVPK